MKILVIGATGTLGSAIMTALGSRHEVVGASRSQAPLTVDLADPDSIRRLYGEVGPVDAVVSAAGQVVFRPLLELTDEDFALGLANKLMGQVNVVRLGLGRVADAGSFTLTSGLLSRQPTPGGAAISMASAALEGFVRAAALEMPRRVRINVIAPGWVSETLAAMGQDAGAGMPAAEVAQRYVEAVEGEMSGQILDAV